MLRTERPCVVFIQVAALTKRYGKLTALDQCSFGAARGEVLGLLGPNGSGKTTLLRLLLGFLRADSGHATIDDLDCDRQSVEVHRRLTYLPGDPRLIRKLTGREILKFFAGLHPASSEKLAFRLAERMELDVSRRVRQMSTGMRQKLALAVTLAPEVPLVVLDEPTSNLDPTARGQVLRMLREAKDAGKTVLFSSHILSEVEEICDRVIVLRQGRVAETLRMADVRQRHRIHALLKGPFEPPNGELASDLEIQHHADGSITILTARPLQPLLGWLATQPLSELQIEPDGLRTVYQKHHPEGES